MYRSFRTTGLRGRKGSERPRDMVARKTRLRGKLRANKTENTRTENKHRRPPMLYALLWREPQVHKSRSSLPPKSRECIFRTPGAGEATRRGRPPIPMPQRANSPSFLGTDGASESCQALGSFPTRACGEQGLPAGGRTVKSVSLTLNCSAIHVRSQVRWALQ